MSERRWLDVAGAILDGSPVAWDTVSQPSPDDPASVDSMRLLAAVAEAHRQPRDSDDPRWGPLELLEKVGSGAFGVVYRARDTALDRDVALKLLDGRPGASAVAEGRLLARVRHPNVVTVYGAAEHDGRYGIWMEFVRGRTLASMVADDGPLRVENAMQVGGDICRALAAVHAAGLVHGDVKAQNVMREDEGGRIVLMDFGTGRFAADPARARLAGTPLYLAPEVLEGAPADIRADIYSAGVLLYYLLTGTSPVEGQNLRDVRAAHQAGRRVGLRERRRNVPPAVIAVIERATSPDPAARFHSATEFEHALTSFGSQWRALRTVPTWVVAAMVLIAGAAAVYGTDRARRAVPLRGTPGASPTAASVASMSVGLLGLDTCSLLGRPSRDGRYMPCFDDRDNLAVNDLVTGAQRIVMSPRGAAITINGAQSSLMSPNGRRVAYAWTINGVSELGIVSTDGAGTPEILPTDGADWPAPLDWSRDGHRLLCWLAQKDGSGHLALVSADGTARTPVILETFREGQPKSASLSPDGRFVAYDLPSDARSGRRAIFVAAADGSSAPHVLLGEPANDQMPFWTPDGRGIFFVSDRSGAMGGWVVPVSSGVAAGEPQFVARDLGRVSAYGLTDQGSLIYMLQTNLEDVWTVPVDLTGHASPGLPVRVSPTTVGGHIGPGWSPDGRWLSYVTASGDTALDRDSNTLSLQDRLTGSTHNLLLDLSRLGVVAPRWAPDSEHLAVEGEDLDNRNGYFIVDARTGHVTPILRWATSQNTDYGGRFFFTPDGRSLLYLHRPRGIIRRELQTGAETIVVPGNHSSFVPSPDGARLAFTSLVNGGSRHASVLTILPLSGGTSREIFSVDLPERLIAQAWSPDSRVILLTRFTPGSSSPHSVWRVDRTGGTPVDMHVAIHGLTGVNAVALSPDGTRLAYTEGFVSWEGRIMRNFLPALSPPPAVVPTFVSPPLPEIKPREASATSSGVAASVGFHERKTVLVAAFDNRTGSPSLDGIVEAAVERELASSQFLNVVPQQRIDDALRLMKKPVDTPLQLDVARELCLRDSGIRSFVTGRLDKSGGRYELTASVVDPADGRVIKTAKVEASSGSTLQLAVRQLSNRLRADLGESAGTIRLTTEALEHVTTPSLQALRLFSDGLHAYERGEHFSEAEAKFTAAITIDPNFASAYIWLAWTRQNLGRSLQEYLAPARRAMDLANSSSEREREWIQASYYEMAGRPDQAIVHYEALLRRYPDDLRALSNLSELYAGHGDRLRDSLDLQIRIADSLPQNFGTQAFTAIAVLHAEGYEAAGPRIARARELMPGPNDDPDELTTLAKVSILLLPAHELWTQGRAADAARILDEVSGRPEFAVERNWTLSVLGNLRLALGQLHLAENAFNRIAEPNLRGMTLAELALARGDRAGIVAGLKTTTHGDFPVVSLLIRAGQLDAAARTLPSAMQFRAADQADAVWSANEIAEARGNRGRIIQALDAGPAWTNWSPASIRMFLYSETLARAAAAIGNRAAAIKVLEDTAPFGGRAYGITATSGVYAMRDQKLLADLYREDGQLDKAHAIERDLLAKLAVADPDYPLLVQLKQRIGK